MKRARIAVALLAGLGLAAPAAAQKAKGKPARPVKVKPTSIDVAKLEAQLHGSDLEAAADAADQLGAAKDAEAHAVLADSVATGLTPRVAVQVLRAMAIHPDPGDLAVLAFFSRYRDADVRAAAARSLGAHEGKAAAALTRVLGDDDPTVRAAAAEGIAAGRVTGTAPALVVLLRRGEEPAAQALGAIADVELARQLGEELGQTPDETLAHCLGAVLLNDDFGPESARVEVVQTLGKIKGGAATAALQAYVDGGKKGKARREAEKLLAERGAA
jgi:hypothetical protein